MLQDHSADKFLESYDITMERHGSQGHKADPAKQTIAVVYARVSSKEQEKEGFSIPAQLKLLRGYAAEHRLTVVEEFVDVETAKRSGRPGFTAMAEFFKKYAKAKTLGSSRFCTFELHLEGWGTAGHIQAAI